jgi:predicted ATPase with chaperone activity
LGVDGEIIRLFDPMNHEECPLAKGEGLLDQSKIDKRWVRIRRPTIVVGGELTMDNLEVSLNTSTGISEAPVQLKSNCGTLVIDDFGRQRMSTDELLNRWIVPLEKRYDFLNLPNGKKIQVPFDQLIVFSTNLEPRDLVDDAFLRRIPYKIQITDPSEQEFHDLFKMMAPKMGFE